MTRVLRVITLTVGGSCVTQVPFLLRMSVARHAPSGNGTALAAFFSAALGECAPDGKDVSTEIPASTFGNDLRLMA